MADEHKPQIDSSSITSLFLLHFGSNTGYAIAPLERTFYEVALELAEGNDQRVHFAYPEFVSGSPRSLPEVFRNFFPFDFRDARPANLQRIVDFASKNQIRLVVAFDIQATHPLFRALHGAGVRTILAYWGAPICSLMPPWRLALKKLRFWLSRSKVDGLIFESQAMADLAIYGRGIPPKMIDIVPLGVDIEQFKPEKTDYVYEAIGFPRDRRVVVYSGHMEARKGVRVLVSAAIELLARRKRSDVCFLICGNKGNESSEFEQTYSGLGIEEFVRFGGYRSDLAKIYPSCFCGVIPSTGWDSFPRSAVEMAACGLPVIASRLQGLPEAVLDRKTGLLFEPGSSQELADRIATMLDDPRLAASYGRQGRKRCEEELNLADHRRRLANVFRKRLGIEPH